MICAETLKSIAKQMVRITATELPGNVVAALIRSKETETSPSAKAQFETMFANLEVAKANTACICQDPGIPVYHAKMGGKVSINFDLNSVLTEAVKEVTKELPIRQNIVHPVSRQNSGTNTGWRIPFIFYDYIWNQDYLELTFMLRGGGAALRSSVLSVAPTVSREEGVKKIVFDMVTMAGGIPCPPTVVGVGIGGTPDIALFLAFEALRRDPIGSNNHDPSIAKIENELYTVLNDTGLGVMGMGGNTTVLGVHIEHCGTHTASMPVAVAFSCWPNRYASCRIYNDNQVKWLSHEVKRDE